MPKKIHEKKMMKKRNKKAVASPFYTGLHCYNPFFSLKIGMLSSIWRIRIEYGIHNKHL